MEKKKMKLWHKILIIILIILTIFIITTLRKYIILSNIETMAKDTEKIKNYYEEGFSIQGKYVVVTKAYYKDDKHLITRQTYGPQLKETRKIVQYKDSNEELVKIQAGKQKVAMKRGLEGSHFSINTLLYNSDFWTKLQIAMLTNIQTQKCNNRDCYVVKLIFDPSWINWIDKDTGIVIRQINGDIINETNYKFNIVTDSNVQKPSIAGYKMSK